MRGYDTVEYARSRLVDTIVMYQKEPVLVLAVGGTNESIILSYEKILGGKGDIAEDKLDRFDINPVSLGYVNHNNTCSYIMRTPMRRDWRQGLRMLNIVDAEGANPRLISYRSIAQTILGNYPSFRSSLEKINNGVMQVAFNRDFAVHHTGTLHYKGIFHVGGVNMNNGNVTLEQGWVQEAFEEAMGNPA